MKLTKQACDRAAAGPDGKPAIAWDDDIAGFGLRVTGMGVKTFVYRYRAGGGGRGAALRQVKLGRYGTLTADAARREAVRVRAIVQTGGDPAGDLAATRADPTIADLCDLYVREGCAFKKPSTLTSDRARIEGHIKPLLGRKRVRDLTKADAERFLQDVATGKSAVARRPSVKALRAEGATVKAALADDGRRRRTDAAARGGKGTASRTVGLLGAIFAFAVDRGLRPDNPVRGVRRFPDAKGERFLSPAELGRLGEALATMEAAGAHPYGLAVIRLLALTGARKNEIQGLRWREVAVDRGQLRLADSKTGAKVLHLAPAAAVILASVESDHGGEYVFPARAGGGHYQGTPRLWEQARAAAGLEDVRLHDLRHSFASFGVAGGFGLPVLGKLLGHRNTTTTARYAHLADDPLRKAGDHIAGAIGAALGVRAVG